MPNPSSDLPDDYSLRRMMLHARPAWFEFVEHLRAYQAAHHWTMKFDLDDGSSHWVVEELDRSAADTATLGVLAIRERLQEVEPESDFLESAMVDELERVLDGRSFEPGRDCDKWTYYEPSGRPSTFLTERLHQEVAREQIAGVSTEGLLELHNALGEKYMKHLDGIRADLKGLTNVEQSVVRQELISRGVLAASASPSTQAKDDKSDEWSRRFEEAKREPLAEWLAQHTTAMHRVTVDTGEPTPVSISLVSLPALRAIEEAAREQLQAEQADLDVRAQDFKDAFLTHLANEPFKLAIKRASPFPEVVKRLTALPAHVTWDRELDTLQMQAETAEHYAEVGPESSLAAAAVRRSRIEMSRQEKARVQVAREAGILTVDLEHPHGGSSERSRLTEQLVALELAGEATIDAVALACTSAVIRHERLVERLDRQPPTQFGLDEPPF